MDREQFRAMQAPLKEKYKRDPGAAVKTEYASGRAFKDLGFTVEMWAGPIEAGMHPAAGGDGTRASAEDMLLQSLVACSGVTLQAVATSMGIELRDARIFAEGDMDVRGTLAVSKDVPVGFREIRLRFELDSDEPDEKLDKLIELTERYCVVLATLRKPPAIVVAHSRAAGTRTQP